jgi:putative Mg2+ transporter-C (MgtC) family protein
MRDLIEERLEAAKYPARDLREVEREDGVEIIATLAAPSVEAAELDAIADYFRGLAAVSHATWSARAED